jgi:hypothetical protein
MNLSLELGAFGMQELIHDVSLTTSNYLSEWYSQNQLSPPFLVHCPSSLPKCAPSVFSASAALPKHLLSRLSHCLTHFCDGLS